MKRFFGESVTKCIWKTNETRTVHWKNLTTTNNSNNNTFAIHFGNWNMSNSWLIVWSNAAYGRLNKTKCQKCVGRGKGRPLPPYKANSKLLQWSIHKFNKLLSARILVLNILSTVCLWHDIMHTWQIACKRNAMLCISIFDFGSWYTCTKYIFILRRKVRRERPRRIEKEREPK